VEAYATPIASDAIGLKIVKKSLCIANGLAIMTYEPKALRSPDSSNENSREL
jgi:hypothetical protein